MPPNALPLQEHFFPPCNGTAEKCCESTRCVLRYRWSPTGFGSRVIVLLSTLLLPAFPMGQHLGLPPGTIEMDDSNFWYSCSPTLGFGCYFRRIRSCAETLGTALRECTSEELSDAHGSLRERTDIRGERSNFLVRGRAALWGIWQYNEETAVFLEQAIQKAVPQSTTAHVTVHIRRGDALGRETQSLHDAARRVRQLVDLHGLHLGKLRVHVMSDDGPAGDQFFHLLHLPDSARVAVPPLPAALASGFQTCLSPRRFGLGPCNCSGPEPKSSSKKEQDVAWRARCLVGGKRIMAPLTYSQTRDLMRALLLDLELARRAHFFIGACTSNVGHVVQLLRSQSPRTAMCLEEGPNSSTASPESFSGDSQCRPCRFPEPVLGQTCATSTACDSNLLPWRTAAGSAPSYF